MPTHPPTLPRRGQSIRATPADLHAVRTPIDPLEMAYAATTLYVLPDSLLEAARDPYDALALSLSLLLDADADVRDAQLRLMTNVDEATATRGSGASA